MKQGSVSAPIPMEVCSDPKESQVMSTAFANMYRAISRLLERSIKVDELKEFLRCFCHSQSPQQLCVDPRVYEGATSTKDILKKLCPEYINPAKLFILEGIVETFGSRQCKKLLRDINIAKSSSQNEPRYVDDLLPNCCNYYTWIAYIRNPGPRKITDEQLAEVSNIPISK